MSATADPPRHTNIDRSTPGGDGIELFAANPKPKPQSPMTNPITQLNHLAIELIANVNQKPIQQEHIDQLWQVTKQINQEMENLNTCRIEIRKVKSDSID
jgi:hypothetical protein